MTLATTNENLPSVPEEEDDEGQEARTEDAFPDSEYARDEDLPTGHLDCPATLLSVKHTEASNGSNIDLQWEVPHEVVQDVNEAMGHKAHDLVFEKIEVTGATVRRYAGTLDADGGKHLKVNVTLPMSERKRAAKLFDLVGKHSVLALNPMQLSLDLTKRAE